MAHEADSPHVSNGSEAMVGSPTVIGLPFRLPASGPSQVGNEFEAAVAISQRPKLYGATAPELGGRTFNI